MGFAFYYRSTRPVTSKEAAKIEHAAAELARVHTWLSCEPLILFASEEDGHLEGSSKPNFQPDSDEAADDAEQGLPDGTVKDLFEILRKLSQSHAIDWEISHDFSGGPIGFIRNGICDREILKQAKTLSSVGEMLGAVMGEFKPTDHMPRANSPAKKSDWDDDDGPPILKFKPKGQ